MPTRILALAAGLLASLPFLLAGASPAQDQGPWAGSGAQRTQQREDAWGGDSSRGAPADPAPPRYPRPRAAAGDDAYRPPRDDAYRPPRDDAYRPPGPAPGYDGPRGADPYASAQRPGEYPPPPGGYGQPYPA